MGSPGSYSWERSRRESSSGSLQQRRLVAVERRDPVPPGRYWIFVKPNELDQWHSWVTGSAGKVKTVVSETQLRSPDGWLWAAKPEAILPGTDGIIRESGGEWVLFDVLAPYPWVKLGLPTIVTDPTIRSSTDVITAPAPSTEDPSVSALRNLVFTAGLFWLASSWLSRKR